MFTIHNQYQNISVYIQNDLILHNVSVTVKFYDTFNALGYN